MAESLIVDTTLSLDEQYEYLQKQLQSLLKKDDKPLSNLSNFVAAIKQSFKKVSWVGIYFVEEHNLFLGPFQGKIACTNIAVEDGVCGTAVKEKKSIIVPNVSKFPSHIACDADTKSEIVVPIFNEDDVFAVLDIDSFDYNSFNKTDAKYLENMCKFLSSFINKSSIIL